MLSPPAVYRFGALWSGVIGAAMLGVAVAQLHGCVQRFGAAVRSGLRDCRTDEPFIATTVFRYFQTETEQTRVRDTFGRYLTDDVVARLLEFPPELR